MRKPLSICFLLKFMAAVFLLAGPAKSFGATVDVRLVGTTTKTQTRIFIHTSDFANVQNPSSYGSYAVTFFNSSVFSGPGMTGDTAFAVATLVGKSNGTGSNAVTFRDYGAAPVVGKAVTVSWTTPMKGSSLVPSTANVIKLRTTSALNTATPTHTPTLTSTLTRTSTPTLTSTLTLTPTQTPLNNQAYIGTGSGTGLAVTEYGDGVYHQSKFTFTAFSVPVTSVTTGNGVGGKLFYTFPVGLIRHMTTQASVTISVGAGQQADFTDATPEGDIGIGTVAMANADSFGTDATDDDFGTGRPYTMSGFSAGVTIPSEATANFDGNVTAIKLNMNVLVDAADIDDDVTTSVLVDGVVWVSWVYGQNVIWLRDFFEYFYAMLRNELHVVI